jgi:ribonuclease J
VAQPEWFTPVHGEYRHLRQHGRLAVQMGVAEEHVLVCEDGDQLVLSDDGVRRVERAVPAGYLYVDGIVGDVGHGVLRDRRVLAEEGVVVVIATVDITTKSVIAGPEVITRGWVHAAEAEDLLDECAAVVRASLEEAFSNDALALEDLARHARRAAGKFVSERTRRRPMIVPVILET